MVHRLSLGEAGVKQMAKIEEQLMGRSELAEASHLAVFAPPQLDFADSWDKASSQRSKDELVRMHVEVPSFLFMA